MNKRENIVKKLKELRQNLKQIREEEKTYQFKDESEKYNFDGTYNIEDMIGKVGFIDKDGKYYPVRDIIYHRDDTKEDIITHDMWAQKYLSKIKNMTGNYSQPCKIIIRKYHFTMLIEDQTTPYIILTSVSYQDKLTIKQEEAIKKLNDYYQNKGKKR